MNDDGNESSTDQEREIKQLTQSLQDKSFHLETMTRKYGLVRNDLRDTQTERDVYRQARDELQVELIKEQNFHTETKSLLDNNKIKIKDLRKQRNLLLKDKSQLERDLKQAKILSESQLEAINQQLDEINQEFFTSLNIAKIVVLDERKFSQ